MHARRTERNIFNTKQTPGSAGNPPGPGPGTNAPPPRPAQHRGPRPPGGGTSPDPSRPARVLSHSLRFHHRSAQKIPLRTKGNFKTGLVKSIYILLRDRTHRCPARPGTLRPRPPRRRHPLPLRPSRLRGGGLPRTGRGPDQGGLGRNRTKRHLPLNSVYYYYYYLYNRKLQIETALLYIFSLRLQSLYNWGVGGGGGALN